MKMKISDEEIECAQKELDGSRLGDMVDFKISLLQLMAVHGAICLGLRHPQMKGPSRAIILQFVKTAEDKFVESGLMKPEHIRIIHAVEEEETEKMEPQ